ncbi:MAG: hypothetical protein ACYCV0_01380 [Desulfitobacteriaceae bacterium]
MSATLLVLAFAAGVLSFLSPCIVPMLGVYFSLITGHGGHDESDGHGHAGHEGHK